MTMIGTQLSGRYRLESKLGSGGMSTVYLAVDEVLDRRVAIKIMHREISDQADQLERFRREARAVASLSHPNLVAVIDAGEDGGHPYIVFEYVPGETLKKRIDTEGRLGLDEATAYAIEIGRGLAAAHAARLIHRDVKPQNVLIDAEGRAKITDFGIARSLEAHGLTATGRVLGTTDYVSPEQAMGKEVDARTDVYSLGIVLYEMLTGDVPFQAETQVGVAMKHVNENVPDVQKKRPETSAALAGSAGAGRRQGPGRPLPGHEPLPRRPRGGARGRGRARRPRDRRGDDGARLGTPQAPQAAEPQQHVVGRSAAADRRGGGRDRDRGADRRRGTVAGGAAGEHRAAARRSRRPRSRPSTRRPGTASSTTRSSASRPTATRTGTAWTTETYDFAELSALKPGVGMVLDAGEPVTPTELAIDTPETGWTIEVYGSDASSPPTTLDKWGDPLAGPITIEENEQVIELNATAENRYFLIWITDAGAGAGRAKTGFRVEISDARLIS